MSSRLLLRGGTAATVGAITPASRELLVNTDTDRVHVGDGTTPGGNPLALLSDVTSSSRTTNLSGSGTASVYTVASDTGTDATIPAATNAAAGVATAAHITELEAIRTILGGVAGGTDLGAFTGSTLSDSSVLRTVLQEVETELEAIRTSQGIAGAAADLGTFTGSIVSDNTTVKNAIQEIETDVDAIQTLTGVAAEATDLGTFTGDVITDNVTIAAAAQELETAIIKNRFVQGTEATAMDNTQNYIIAASGTVTLPASPFTGQRVWVYDATGAANTTNIAVNNSAAVLQTNLDQNSQFKAFAWNGSAWVILWDSKAHLPQKHLHVSTSTTLQSGQNYIIFADTAAASADIVITLPVAPVVNQSIWIYDKTDNATTWNVLTGSDIRLYSDGASVHLVYDGAAWQTVFDSQDLEQSAISSKVGTGPGYYFDSTSVIQTPLNISGWSDLTFYADFEVNSFASSQRLFSDYINDSNVKIQIEIATDKSLKLILCDGSFTNASQYTTPPILKTGRRFSVCVSRLAGIGVSVYLNGKKVSVTEPTLFGSGAPEVIGSSGGNIAIGRFPSISNSNLLGEIYRAKVFNRALTATEIKQVSNGQYLGFADYGASGVAQTSGTLTIGKRYIISDYIAGDDFTNVGAAANATGEVFIATGTTPTTWANLSGITQQGLVLDLNENGIGENTWTDASGNDYDGTNNGATAINIPKYEEINTNYVKLTDLIWIGIDGGVLSKTNDAGATWTAI